MTKAVGHQLELLLEMGEPVCCNSKGWTDQFVQTLHNDLRLKERMWPLSQMEEREGEGQ